MPDIQHILIEIAGIVKKEMDMKYQLFLSGSRAGGKTNQKAGIDIGIIADKPVLAKTMVTIKEKLELFPPLLKKEVFTE